MKDKELTRTQQLFFAVMATIMWLGIWLITLFIADN